jgi:glycosyltransferase involved in cell wall biosynthesis
MFKGQKVTVVMPAYNAALTLEQTYNEIIEQQIVDDIILVDDCSSDATIEIARKLPGVKTYVHSNNKGYGANQKTCYKAALSDGADIIIMIHPDY